MKVHKSQTNVLMLVVMIVIGVAALLGTAYNLTVTQQSVFPVSNESISSDGSSYVQLDNVHIHSGTIVVSNSTSGNLVTPRDYQVKYYLGQVRVNKTPGSYNVSYSYEPGSYAGGGVTSTILGIVPILIAVGLLILAGRAILRGS